jgi:hypothetical protein
LGTFSCVETSFKQYTANPAVKGPYRGNAMPYTEKAHPPLLGSTPTMSENYPYNCPKWQRRTATNFLCAYKEL